MRICQKIAHVQNPTKAQEMNKQIKKLKGNMNLMLWREIAEALQHH